MAKAQDTRSRLADVLARWLPAMTRFKTSVIVALVAAVSAGAGVFACSWWMQRPHRAVAAYHV